MTYLKNHPFRSHPARWAALGFFLISTAIYLFGLGNPERLYWDETIHVNAARTMLYGEAGARNYPPLGHEMLVVSLALFGDTPAGARGLSALCGAAGIALIFLIGRRLTRNPWIGALSALLLLFEPLFYLHSRIGMLDMFVTFFMILSFWIFLKIRERNPEQRPFYLYYLLGTSLGLAFSVKMVAAILYPIFLTDLIWAAWKLGDAQKKKLRVFHLLAAFSLPTLLVFWGAYALLGHSLTEIRDHLAWYYGFMSTFQGHPRGMSRWYEWLYVKMPLWYLKIPFDKTHMVAVVATGNHLLWIGAEIIFVILLFCRKWINKEIYFLHLIIAAQFLFWEVKPTTHLYYMLPVVPFYALLIGVFFQFLLDRFPAKKKYIRADAVVFLLCSLFVFGYYFPLLTGRPIATEKMNAYLFPGSGAPATDSRASASPP
jgi:4-amino-4-deoxy-L-arabinose transferase-like glycosyltransferase